MYKMKPARSRPRTGLGAAPISRRGPTIMDEKTRMWISALLYSPLYTAPSPGKKPRTKAMPGLLVERPGAGAGGRTPGAEAAGFGAPAGTAPGMPTIVARQSSQYSTSRTGRTHAEHMAFPQFRQYPTASTSEWTAHFMAFSSRPSNDSER